MTIDEMRVITGAGADVTDEEALVRYGNLAAAAVERGLAIEEVRAQVRLERTDDSEDTYLKLLVLAATRAVRNELQRPVDITTEDPDNDVIKIAILLLVGHWFDKREPVAVGSQSSELPMTVTFLLNPIRKWVC